MTTGTTGVPPVASSFAYNDRSEIVSATIGTNHFLHAYDTIGNQTNHVANAATNTFTHNAVCIGAQNQPPCNGRAVRYEKKDGETLVEGHADWRGAPPELDSFIIRQWDEASYEGVSMERTILHRDEYFLEAFRVREPATGGAA